MPYIRFEQIPKPIQQDTKTPQFACTMQASAAGVNAEKPAKYGVSGDVCHSIMKRFGHFFGRYPALGGFALFFALTIFCMGFQSAYEGVFNRNRSFDKGRWWYPIYKTFNPNTEPS